MLEQVDIVGTGQPALELVAEPDTPAEPREKIPGHPCSAPQPEEMSAVAAIRAAFECDTVPYLNEAGEVRIRGAAAQLPPAVRRALKTHRNQIRALLAEPVGYWPLGVFMASTSAVAVYSELLGDLVILAGARADLNAFRERHNISRAVVIYQGRDLLTALRGGALQLQVLHEFKRDGGAPLVVSEEHEPP